MSPSNTTISPALAAILALPTTPTIPTATETPLPADQQAALLLPYDLRNALQQEARMNLWLMGVERQHNAQLVQNYLNAYRDWRMNAIQYAALSMPVPPSPNPPTLEAVGPQPSGYWFLT